MEKILVINIGSTSTKVAYYRADQLQYIDNIEHAYAELQPFETFMDQSDFRKAVILDFLAKHELKLEELDAIVSRGGHTQPIEGGVYAINPEMLAQQASGLYGAHPCDIGSKIAYELAQASDSLALILDAPVTDEFEPVARLSGHPLFPRKSAFHALSHKATAKRYAKEQGLHYPDLNLIVVHLGGGISVAPHRKGRMIDGDNGLTGDGAYSTNRTGALPVGALVEACFSGDYTQAEVKRMLQGEGGLFAYTGTTDVREILEQSEQNPEAKLSLDGMIYQVCKQIGAMATVLQGQVDAILITGGIAYSDYVIEQIKASCGFLAPIAVYPGENEMQALANGALEALRDRHTIRVFQGK